MGESVSPLLRVRDWNLLYENNRSREIKRAEWFPESNDLSADTYIELIDHENGAAHFGAWTAIRMVASRARPRSGLLIKSDGQPHTAESLARVTRIPETILAETIQRLVSLGLLEIVDTDLPGISDLPPHPPAGTPQDDAGKPRRGAAEGKGTEHHHQEGDGKEGKRTERADEESNPEQYGRRSSAENLSPRGVDDEARPGEIYASPEDELKAIYLAKAGEPITVAVLDAIRVNLELNRVPMDEFVSGLRAHLAGNWKNPAGFLRDLSKRFRSKNQQATGPVTAAEAEEANYRCDICGGRVRGEGIVIGHDGRWLPCRCAAPEWVARQRARGVFGAGTPQ